MHANIVCFGAAHLDHKAVAKAEIVWGSKNPVTMTTSFGGVARNVADNLSRLGEHVALVSCVGHDQAGDMVMASLKVRGIDAGGVSRLRDQKTASFTALVEPSGTMAVALSDMDIYDHFACDALVLKACEHARIWLVDANFSEEVLTKIAEFCPPQVELWAIGTSVAKNPRLLAIISRIKVLVVNEQEARLFVDARPPNMIVTRGERGLVLLSGEFSQEFSVIKQKVVDETGAGDALVAGLLFGYVREGSLIGAMPYAIACASITLECVDTVSPSLSLSSLRARVSEKL